MSVLTAIAKWGWSPILITVVALIGLAYEWELAVLAAVLPVILIIGLVITVVNVRERELARSSLKIRQLAGYFHRRFMGDSSLSIFAIIDTLFNVDDPKLWDWARACDMSQRILNTWSSSFTGRIENDVRTRRFDVFLPAYLNELWLANTHYYEFVEQFREIGDMVEVPKEAREQYNRFVAEYNAFVQQFRDMIAELRKMAKTEIEPPSVNFARELTTIK